jgi:NAD(P)H dehydrogenase (quinone)
MIAITGATGQLGRLVVAQLLDRVPAGEIVAAVRSPEKAADLAERGVAVRRADYDDPDTLTAAFAGVDKLLFISSSEVGQRVRQHGNVIEAAKRAGVDLVAYTSVLHADNSPLGLAEEHRRTEDALAASGVSYVLLRNGWYLENYGAAVPTALEHGVILGCAGDGRISAATRADFAAAGAAVMTGEDPAGRIYELAGDESFTLTELAEEISRQSGKPVTYRNLSQAEHQAALVGAGLPEPIAALLADSDAGIAQGALFDNGRALSRLIGRPTTPLAAVVALALEG